MRYLLLPLFFSLLPAGGFASADLRDEEAEPTGMFMIQRRGAEDEAKMEADAKAQQEAVQEETKRRHAQERKRVKALKAANAKADRLRQAQEEQEQEAALRAAEEATRWKREPYWKVARNGRRMAPPTISDSTGRP